MFMMLSVCCGMHMTWYFANFVVFQQCKFDTWAALRGRKSKASQVCCFGNCSYDSWFGTEGIICLIWGMTWSCSHVIVNASKWLCPYFLPLLDPIIRLLSDWLLVYSLKAIVLSCWVEILYILTNYPSCSVFIILVLYILSVLFHIAIPIAWDLWYVIANILLGVGLSSVVEGVLFRSISCGSASWIN